MIPPHKRIEQYITCQLDKAWLFACESGNLPEESRKIVPLWQLSSNSSRYVFTTSCVFKIASNLKLPVQNIGEAIVKFIADPLKYFSNIEFYNGYINVYVSTLKYQEILNELLLWLKHTPELLTPAVMKVNIPSDTPAGQNYRINAFRQAKSNLLKSWGYRVNSTTIYNQDIFVPSIEIHTQTFSQQSFVGPVHHHSYSWRQITDNFSPSALTYIVLNANINAPITFDYTSTPLHIDNPLYLVSYIQTQLNKFNYVELDEFAIPFESDIIPKILHYTQCLEDCVNTIDINKIFLYLQQLSRLTFEVNLWQNCIEKTSYFNVIKSVINHGLKTLECSFAKT